MSIQRLFIRKVKPIDVPKILELIKELAVHHNQLAYLTTTEEEIKEATFGKEAKMSVLVAELDNKVVGYLSYTWNYAIWNAKEYMALDDLYVTQKHRGYKIGKKLMEEAKLICLDYGISTIKWEVETANKNAIRFYEKLGPTMNTKGIFKWNLKEN